MARRRSSSVTGHGGAGPSQRQLRVGELIRHAVSELLLRGDVRDPVLQRASVTVSEVRPSPDLRTATCFVATLGGGETGPVVEALNRSAPWISGRIAGALRTRFTPRLRFLADTSFDEVQRIDRLLQSPKVAGDLARPDGDSGDGDDDGPA